MLPLPVHWSDWPLQHVFEWVQVESQHVDGEHWAVVVVVEVVVVVVVVVGLVVVVIDEVVVVVE